MRKSIEKFILLLCKYIERLQKVCTLTMIREKFILDFLTQLHIPKGKFWLLFHEIWGFHSNDHFREDSQCI